MATRSRFFGVPVRQAAAFHAAALYQGRRCNGLPGLRPEYGERYDASVIDPGGYRIGTELTEVLTAVHIDFHY